jgi:hypothetical protein
MITTRCILCIAITGMIAGCSTFHVRSHPPIVRPQMHAMRIRDTDDARTQALFRQIIRSAIASYRTTTAHRAWFVHHPYVRAVAEHKHTTIVRQARTNEKFPQAWLDTVAALHTYPKGTITSGCIVIDVAGTAIAVFIDDRSIRRLHDWEHAHINGPQHAPLQTHEGPMQPWSIGHDAAHASPHELLAAFSGMRSRGALDAIATHIGAAVHGVRYTDGHTTVLFRATDAVIAVMRARIATHRPLYAEPHYWYAAHTIPTPNDELYAPYQWNIAHINTPSGWERTLGNNDVIVAVVDTGVQLDHPDVQGRLVAGYNAIDPQSPPYDDVGHGTHVAGIIAAQTNNDFGVAGLTWRTRIMPIKVLDAFGTGDAFAVADGIRWATDHGAHVINLSLGNYAGARYLHEAIVYAYNHGVALIAAAGNDESDQPGYPAAYAEVLAVTATDETRQKASFANYGAYVDVAAPGTHITSTYVPSVYATMSGTSMASPHVAALAALIKANNVHTTPAQTYDRIMHTANDVAPRGIDAYTGAGIIDVARALAPHSPPPRACAWWQRLWHPCARRAP